MSNTKALISTGDVEQIIKSIQPSEEAVQKQQQILAITQPFKSVEFEGDEQDAIKAASLAQGFLTQIKEAHKEVKAPFLRAGEQVDKVKDDLFNPVHTEYTRVTALISGYRSEVQRKLAEDRRRFREEQQKLEDEKLKLEEERQALQRREEMARLAAMAAKTTAARKKAAEALAKVESEKEEQEWARAEIAERAEEVSKVVIEDKPMEGAAVRKDYEIELIDPVLVYLNHPEFCEVTVKKSIVKEWLKTNWDGKTVVPGLHIVEKLTTAVRGVNPNLALK